MICWRRQHPPPSWCRRGAFSASQLQLWGSKTHGVLLIEGKVSMHPHKGGRGKDLSSLTDPKSKEWGTTDSSWLQERQFSIPGHSEPEVERRGANIYYSWSPWAEVTNFSQAQFWMNILKDALEKAKQELVAGNLSSGLYLNIQTFDASRGFIL